MGKVFIIKEIYEKKDKNQVLTTERNIKNRRA